MPEPTDPQVPETGRKRLVDVRTLRDQLIRDDNETECIMMRERYKSSANGNFLFRGNIADMSINVTCTGSPHLDMDSDGTGTNACLFDRP